MKVLFGKKSGRILFCAAICHFLISGAVATAQLTIANVPSSDILDRGKIYYEQDFSFKVDKNRSNVLNRFTSFVPRYVFGVGRNVEVGVNFLGNLQPGRDLKTIAPIVKWKVFERKGFSVVTGNHLYIPISNRTYKIGNYFYTQASQSFGAKTRLTAGGYYFTKKVVADNRQFGGQFGIEQQVSKKFGVAADWFTGKNSAGYFTPITNYKINRRVTFFGGYSLGNTNLRRGNHFFFTAVGIDLKTFR